MNIICIILLTCWCVWAGVSNWNDNGRPLSERSLCCTVKKKRVDLSLPKKNATLVWVSLCLSQACLGKMMRFIYKWRQNGVFRVNLSLLVDHEQTDGACSLVAARKSCAEKRSYFSRVPWRLSRACLGNSPFFIAKQTSCKQRTDRTTASNTERKRISTS